MLIQELCYCAISDVADIIQKCEMIRKLLIWLIGHGSVCSSCLPQPLLTQAYPWTSSQPVSLPGSPPALLLPFLGQGLFSSSPAPTAGGQWHMKCMWKIIGVYNANNLSIWPRHECDMAKKKKKKQYGTKKKHNLSDFILYTQMKEGISKHDLYWAVLLDLPELSSWSCSKSQRGRRMGSWLEKAFLQEFQNFAENLKTFFFQLSVKRENSSDILFYREQFLWKCIFFHQNTNFLFEENRFESKFLTSPSHH